MKVAKFFSVIFAAVGIVLMLASCVICFASLNTPVKVFEYPEDVAVCYDRLAEAVQAGDYATMEQLFYGSPQLGAQITPEDPYSAMVWEAFRGSMQLTYTEKAYLSDSDFVRDATLSVLDIASVTGKLESTVQTVLHNITVAAEDPTVLYDANGSYRADVVENALQQALDQLLTQDAPYVTVHTAVKLIRRDGRWWVLPDQTFLKTISGLAA